jgi:hypothetical protein
MPHSTHFHSQYLAHQNTLEGLDDDALAKSLATARSRHASESIFDIDTPQGRVRLKVTNLMVVEIVDNNIGVIDPGGQSCQFCSSTGRLSPRRPNVDLNRRDSGAKRDSQPPRRPPSRQTPTAVAGNVESTSRLCWRLRKRMLCEKKRNNWVRGEAYWGWRSSDPNLQAG